MMMPIGRKNTVNSGYSNNFLSCLRRNLLIYGEIYILQMDKVTKEAN
jgi:hypothetical protein